MFGKKIQSVRKLMKKVKLKTYILLENTDITPTPQGYVAIYAGKERSRFVVPTEYLVHPLFKMILEKAYTEFGFDQKTGLLVPFSVSTFKEVMNVVECSHGNFDLTNLVQELVESES